MVSLSDIIKKDGIPTFDDSQKEKPDLHRYGGKERGHFSTTDQISGSNLFVKTFVMGTTYNTLVLDRNVNTVTEIKPFNGAKPIKKEDGKEIRPLFVFGEIVDSRYSEDLSAAISTHLNVLHYLNSLSSIHKDI